MSHFVTDPATGQSRAMTAQEEADYAAWNATLVPAPIRRITSSAFVQRFTAQEYALQIADPVLAQAAAAAGYQLWVNLDSPKMAQLLAYAVSKGYLTADRVGTAAGQLLADGTTAETQL